MDMLTEEMADQGHELRWALTPGVMQHIGGRSSKGDDFGEGGGKEKEREEGGAVEGKGKGKGQMSVAEKLWSFGFEKNEAGALRREHLRFGGG